MRIIALIIFVCFVCCNHLSPRKFEKDDIVATINYKMSGCFGGETCNLVVAKSNKKMVAALNSHQRNYTVVLDSNQINAYHKFISELKTLDFDFGCTTEEFYSVKIGEEKIEKTDGGCDWHGFTTLMNVLFPKKALSY